MSRHTLILFFSLSINTQEIPNEFFEFQINKLEDDLEENWLSVSNQIRMIMVCMIWTLGN